MKIVEKFLSETVKSTSYDGKVFIAGGYVRDEVLGVDSKDIDLVVELENGGIEFANWITTKLGIYKEGSNPVVYPTFGTAKFNFNGITFEGHDLSNVDIEVVMTRQERYTPGSRKPQVSVGTIRDDVQRRDFTVNSLLKNVVTGEILDLTGLGISDIHDGIVRTPLDPDIIFTEDPLRMLRAIRFTAKYNWKLPLFMFKAIKKNAKSILTISDERIRDEINKMLITNSPVLAIEILRITGLLEIILPDIHRMIGVEQNKFHDKDAYGHTLDVLNNTPSILTKRLAALFHDVGKVDTKTEVDGVIHFYGHADKGSEITEIVLKSLKYSSDEITRVSKVIKNHMRLKESGDFGEEISNKSLRKLRREVGECLEDTLDVMQADNSSHSDKAGAMRLHQIEGIRKRLQELDADRVQGIKLPVSGDDIIREFRIKPGPIFKELLDLVQDAVDENPDLTREEGLQIISNKLEL
jgi:poly(A) polymerase